MDLTPYVETLRRELAVAADAGGDDARELAERLTSPLESATRLTLLNALSDAMDDVTARIAPGSVDVRLRGLEPEFVVTLPPAPEPAAAAPAPAPVPAPEAHAAEAEDGGATARINLRLTAHLKTRAEEAAAREGLSLNAWLTRAVASAVEPAHPSPGAAPTPGPAPGSVTARRFTGWVR